MITAISGAISKKPRFGRTFVIAHLLCDFERQVPSMLPATPPKLLLWSSIFLQAAIG